MQRRSGLGRGLGALIPNEVTTDDGVTSQLIDLPIADIVPNRYQPREHFDEESLASLTASIRELGVLQPVLVRETAEGYELIAGERRWRAAHRAGLQRVPAIVRRAQDLDALEQAVVENLHRDDLNPLEEAAAYEQLIEDFDLTQEEVATRVGRSRSSVANTLRLLQLPPEIQRYLIDGELTAGHARALLSLADDGQRMKVAREVVSSGASVRETEARCRTLIERPSRETTDRPRPTVTVKEPAVLELEGLLGERLATRVSIDMGAQGGRMVIQFADLDDLERIYRILQGDPTGR